MARLLPYSQTTSGLSFWAAADTSNTRTGQAARTLSKNGRTNISHDRLVATASHAASLRLHAAGHAGVRTRRCYGRIPFQFHHPEGMVSYGRCIVSRRGAGSRPRLFGGPPLFRGSVQHGIARGGSDGDREKENRT